MITGAGSGIGRALATRLAELGADLALSDVDPAGLEETQLSCKQSGARVQARVVDVTDRTAVLAYADEVVAELGGVDLVFNNAGIGILGSFEELSHEQFKRVVDVDFWGVVHGTEAFLPHLVASGDGHLVNISSMFGLVAVPRQSPYNAAKFAVRGFTEALRQEMLMDGRPVAVTCVHPGGVKTRIAHSSEIAGDPGQTVNERFEKVFFRTSAQDAADVILSGVAKRRARVLIGADAHAMSWLSRIAGGRYQRVTMLMTRLMPEPTVALGGRRGGSA